MPCSHQAATRRGNHLRGTMDASLGHATRQTLGEDQEIVAGRIEISDGRFTGISTCCVEATRRRVSWCTRRFYQQQAATLGLDFILHFA